MTNEVWASLGKCHWKAYGECPEDFGTRYYICKITWAFGENPRLDSIQLVDSEIDVGSGSFVDGSMTVRSRKAPLNRTSFTDSFNLSTRTQAPSTATKDTGNTGSQAPPSEGSGDEGDGESWVHVEPDDK